VEKSINGAASYHRTASHCRQSILGKSSTQILKEEHDKQRDEFSRGLGIEVPDILALSRLEVAEPDQFNLDEDLLRLNMENTPLFLSKPEQHLPSFEGDDF
jgi:hypothetical protein